MISQPISKHTVICPESTHKYSNDVANITPKHPQTIAGMAQSVIIPTLGDVHTTFNIL